MTEQKCEKCGRIRSVKNLQRAVYVRRDRSGDLILLSEADAYRCAARASCRVAARNAE